MEPVKRQRSEVAEPRILFVLSSLAGGGAERVASVLLNTWAEQGEDVGLLTLSTRRSDHYRLHEKVSRTRLDMIYPSSNVLRAIAANWRRVRELRLEIRAYRPDAVVVFIETINVLVLAALIGTGIRVVVSERIDPRHYRIGWLRRIGRRLMYPLACALVVQTSSVANWARRVVSKKRVHIIPNPIADLPDVDPETTRQKTIVAVGRLAPQKGFDVLLQAFAMSGARSKGWRLAILGEGDARRALEKLVVDLGIDGDVFLPGLVEEPWGWLEHAGIFVLSSRFEGFPNALLEAMGMGCAVVSTDCPSGPGDIVTHEHNGLLVPVADIPELARAIDRLADDSQLRERLGEQAIAVRREYQATIIARQWLDLLVKLKR